MELRNILLTTDFSEAAREAYPVAVSLAKKLGAGIHLVHVAEPLPPFFWLQSGNTDIDVPDHPYYDELRKRVGAEAGNKALNDLPPTAKLLQHRDPCEALNRYARENGIGLLVASNYGHSGLGHVLLGSFASTLVRYSDIPVLVYREIESPAAYNPNLVLVPFDFSPCARAVLPWVRTLSERCGSRFVFLHALEPAPTLVGTIDEFAERSERALGYAREDSRSGFDALRRRELAGISCEFEVRLEPAHRRILEYAKESRSDLILVATHGRSGLASFLHGSVAEKVVRKAMCPVMTVRAPMDDT